MSATRWVPDVDVDEFTATADDVAAEFTVVEESHAEPFGVAEPDGIAEPVDEVEEDLDEPVLSGRGEVPAWVISLGVHVAVLAILGTIAMETVGPQQTDLSSVVEQVDPQEYKLDSTIVDQIGSDSTINSLSPSQATATEQGNEPQKQTEEYVHSTLSPTEVPFTERTIEPNRTEAIAMVDRTGTVEHPGGIEGAVDRITMEIAASLRRDKTLVIWLFDRSPSVNQRRDAIADRFENVYRQLGMLQVGEDRALKTAVAAFGDDWEILTEKAVDDYTEVVDAVRNIEPSSSGVENVFTAAREVASRFEQYRRPTKNRREVMLVVVTDEAGSDTLAVEETINYLRRKSIRAYVVGNAAPFGKKEVEIPWEYQGQMVTAVLEPGPETFFPERLQLPFWATGTRDLKQMSSGFGPYALTRLCVETGGMFLVTDDTSGPRFDPAVMRNYAPDYSPPKKYVERLAENEAKVALVQTIAKFDPAVKNDPLLKQLVGEVVNVSKTAFSYAQIGNVNVPGLQKDFVADNDNVLRRQISEAQRPIAVFDHQLEQMERVLLQDEKARKEIEDARWRANFDLAAGRLLALRVRAHGYNKVLAEMKNSPKPFEKQGSNRWRLKPSREIDSGPAVRKMAKQAEEYLRRVIDDHPGTPWAVLAERELSQPMGWRWEEYRVNVVDTGRRPGEANDDPRLLLADEEEKRRRERERPKRPPVPKRIEI